MLFSPSGNQTRRRSLISSITTSSMVCCLSRAPGRRWFLFHPSDLCKGFPSVTIKDSNGYPSWLFDAPPPQPVPGFFPHCRDNLFYRTGNDGEGTLVPDTGVSRGRRNEERDIATILSSISSRNEGSIRFPARHGFLECGRFRDVGQKNGVLFDVVWMQKMI
jgi:hypothetical protein